MQGPRDTGGEYRPVGQDENDTPPPPPSEFQKLGIRRRAYLIFISALAGSLVVILVVASARSIFGIGTPFRSTVQEQTDSCPCRPPDVPQYFQTSPELWAGPTATGKAPFLAQTVSFEPTATYVPNAPLQTSIPIQGMGQQNESIFKLMASVLVLYPRARFPRGDM